ncbi:YciI family protein [Kiloniella antarctica]|uniref:YciI family protein n=1 Tax=Kiloniella antarctica TaxID=1550907 RepID=A0ABW5BII8_9PROT
MAKYLFIYHGGAKPENQEDGKKAMAAWMEWFESIGDKVIDGGNPVGLSTTVMSDGNVVRDGGTNPAGGYSLFEAKDVEEAISMAKGCPILAAGGSIELAETFDP